MTKHPQSSFALASSLIALTSCYSGDSGLGDGGPAPLNPSVDPSEGDASPTTSGDIATTEDPDDPSTTSTAGDSDDPTTTTATTATTTDPGDTNDLTTTTDVPSICGDGVQDPGEQCDDGEANNNNAFCTVQCKVNVCGDGHKFTGVELCDTGIANSDDYGNFCGADCTPGIFCGDGLTQKGEGEQCDDGPINGMPEMGTSCDSVCHIIGLRAFITEEAFTGDLDGFDGADEKCQIAALTAGMVNPGSFRAVLSTGTMSANDRLTPLIGLLLPYILPGGQQIATSFPDLMAGGPGDTGINVTEHGVQLLDAYVATNTTPTGESAPHDPDVPALDCDGWTSADKNLFAHIGYNAVSEDDPSWPIWKDDGWWMTKKIYSCDSQEFHLYCLEF